MDHVKAYYQRYQDFDIYFDNKQPEVKKYHKRCDGKLLKYASVPNNHGQTELVKKSTEQVKKHSGYTTFSPSVVIKKEVFYTKQRTSEKFTDDDIYDEDVSAISTKKTLFCAKQKTIQKPIEEDDIYADVCLNDLFAKLPDVLKTITSEYVNPIPTIVRLARENKRVPSYLIENMRTLDFRGESLSPNAIIKVLKHCKDLKFLKVSVKSTKYWYAATAKDNHIFRKLSLVFLRIPDYRKANWKIELHYEHISRIFPEFS